MLTTFTFRISEKKNYSKHKGHPQRKDDLLLLFFNFFFVFFFWGILLQKITKNCISRDEREGERERVCVMRIKRSPAGCIIDYLAMYIGWCVYVVRKEKAQAITLTLFINSSIGMRIMEVNSDR